MSEAARVVLGRWTAKSLQRFLLLVLPLKHASMSSKGCLVVKFSKKYTHHLFAIQCNETTDVDQLAQLLDYVRFVRPSSTEEKMLFGRPPETIIKAVVFQVVTTFLTTVA